MSSHALRAAGADPGTAMVSLLRGKSLRFTALGAVKQCGQPGEAPAIPCASGVPGQSHSSWVWMCVFFPLVTFWDSNVVTGVHREAQGIFVVFKTRFLSESGVVHVRWVKDLEDPLQGAVFFAC